MADKVNEKSILDKLFTAGEESPEQTVKIPRIGLSVTLKALREDAIEKLEKQFTKVKMIRGQETKEIDKNRHFRALIDASTVAIGGDRNITWSHPELLSRYQASGAEQVIKRVLLAGEISMLVDIIFNISGYYDQAEEEEELKN